MAIEKEEAFLSNDTQMSHAQYSARRRSLNAKKSAASRALKKLIKQESDEWWTKCLNSRF
jgi:hypothetical protein